MGRYRPVTARQPCSFDGSSPDMKGVVHSWGGESFRGDSLSSALFVAASPGMRCDRVHIKKVKLVRVHQFAT
ncbi:hypothetical protein RGQ21_10240 [Kitasatospora aureofaciens]|nr:hypothetical protein RGQ21_10240 [Kitasatospora aureofaciens]